MHSWLDPAVERRVYAYHGTTATVSTKVLDELRFEEKIRPYHWLGNGVYFFEEAPVRAYGWALREAEQTKGEPAVIGVELNLSSDVLDLCDIGDWPLVHRAHEIYVAKCQESGLPAETQKPPKLLLDPDPQYVYEPKEATFAEKGIGNNKLDCAALNHVKKHYQSLNGTHLTAIRCSFMEGPPVYETSFLYVRNHAQINVIDQSIICDIFPVPINQIVVG
ncbi:MAG: hypothetical protein JXQ99_04130 [Hyphomicrobiaceae bacterium]